MAARATACRAGAPPLTGVWIIHLTRIFSGPFCTMIRADMGADLIKIEDPGEGDPIRNIGAGRDDLSWYFAAFNRNKRSMALDVKAAAGRQTLLRLLADADVLVEGLDQATLDTVNPRLVVASISGFGATGPFSHPTTSPPASCRARPATTIRSPRPTASSPRATARLPWHRAPTRSSGALLSVLGIEEILELPRFRTNDQRLVHGEHTAEILAELAARDAPSGPGGDS